MIFLREDKRSVEDMTVGSPLKVERKAQAKRPSRHGSVPPRNPNKRPTIINLDRSIGRMKANDMDAIRRAAE